MLSNFNLFRNLLSSLVSSTNSILEDKHTICLFRMSDTDFTRPDKSSTIWSFMSVCLASMLRASVNVTDLFSSLVDKKILNRETTYASFFERRSRINYLVFPYIMDALNRIIYHDYSNLAKDENGKIDLAVDTSTLKLPKVKKLFETFGGQKNQFGFTPMLRISAIINAKTNTLVDLIVAPYWASERDLFNLHLLKVQLLGLNPKDVIFITDRGYPSVDIFDIIEENGFTYIIRVPKDFNNEIKNVTSSDEIISYQSNHGAQITQRVITLELFSKTKGETISEILVTNDFKSDRNYFQKKYDSRWSVETEFRFIKHLYGEEIMEFKNEKVHSILTSIYSIGLNNIFISIQKCMMDCKIKEREEQKRINQEQKLLIKLHLKKLNELNTKQSKCNFQTNVTTLYGRTKSTILAAIMTGDANELVELMLNINKSNIKEQIRPGRWYARYEFNVIKVFK